MKILFFDSEQYVSFEDEPFNHEVRLPILNCGLVTSHRDYVYQRVLRSEGRRAMNRRAVQEVDEFGPDLVVCSTTWDEECLSPRALRHIVKTGVPLYIHAFDTHIRPRPKEIEWFLYGSYLGVADSVSNYLRYRSLLAYSEAKGVLFTPGHNVFTDFIRKKDLPKVYDVVMLGSNEGLRVQLTQYLKETLAPHNIFIHKLGGLVDSTRLTPVEGLRLTDRWVTWDSYVHIINQSKICLSSQTVSHRCQIKGKIFDILACGTLCLSDSNPEIRRIVPEGCVVYYDGFEDCLEKILYYMKHEDERRRVAEAGYRWYHETFDYKKFWSQFLRAAVHGDAPLPTLPSLEAAFEEMRQATPQPKALVELLGLNPLKMILVKHSLRSHLAIAWSAVWVSFVSALKKVLSVRTYTLVRGWWRGLKGQDAGPTPTEAPRLGGNHE